MSLSRNNKIWGVAENLLNRLAKARKSSAREQKTRKLAIDQLEERQLLSLTVATTENLLVNTSWQDIRGDIAADSNSSGDIVVAWTAADRLANPDYVASDETSSPYLLDDNGDYVEDLNIYARYLTDEVQVITIPEECVPGTDLGGSKSASGSFELLYNAYETQRLSIFVSDSFSYYGTGEGDVYQNTTNSQIALYLGLYAEGELTWVLYRYDTALLPGDNAANLQSVLNNIPGGEYKDVEVTAYSETDFDITFKGDNWAGYDLTDIRVSNDYFADITAIMEKVSAAGFQASDLKGCTVFQKLILTDLFGANYVQTVSQMIATSKVKSVLNKLQIERDKLVDNLASANVTTVNEVRSITSFNSRGERVGIIVDSNPYKTAQNIQNAFNAVSQQPTLYAPITRGYKYNEKTHRYEYESVPTRPYSSNESYGTMQNPIKPIEVVVSPVPGSTNQFRVTFTGASGLMDQDALIVSAASYSSKIGKNYVYTDVVYQDTKTGKYVVDSDTYDESDATAVTIKQSSNVFRVNAVETADFVLDEDGDVVTDRSGQMLLNGTGRTDQSKPSAAMSEDGSFIIAWQHENADVLQEYNATEIMARRFKVQGYVEETDPYYSSLTFYENGAVDGKNGNTNNDGTVFTADPYDTNAQTDVVVQCVQPVANEFRVNASTNGMQVDPTVSSDLDGNFIVAWTYIAQDSSYFGGIYGRQFNNDAEPTTGDITFASSQVSSNYYGPAFATMSSNGFAVVMWNYGYDMYYSVLEPYSGTKFIVDNELVAENAHGSGVDFDYNDRFAMTYTVEAPTESGGTAAYPTTDVVAATYRINPISDTTTYVTTTGNQTTVTTVTASIQTYETGLFVGLRQNSTDYEVEALQTQTFAYSGDQGNSSVGLDADGDLFLAYQGLGSPLDIQYFRYDSSTAAGQALLQATSDLVDLPIQLEWSDFEDNNLVYYNKRFYRGQKYSYESKNEDLIKYVKLALGWGYDEDGELVDDGAVTVPYHIHGYDCIDVDSYIRYFQTVAQKEKATDEQLVRLNAVLETLLSPLRNNGNDISFANASQTMWPTITTTTTTASSSSSSTTTGGDSSSSASASGSASTTTTSASYTATTTVEGVVSSYRNGSNACFYIALPSYYVATATMGLTIGRATDRDAATILNPESISVDLGAYYDANVHVADPYAMAQGMTNALNALTICNDASEGASCFVVRPVSLQEIEFYKDTYAEIDLDLSEFQYYYSYTEDNVTYNGWRTIEDFVVLQITAQGDLHDTPLTIAWDYANSAMTLVDQATEGANYRNYQGFYVERTGSTGNFQTNPHVAETTNGDLAVVWGMQSQTNATRREDVYPSIGNDLSTKYTHVYMRSFRESTDTAGPIVTNLSLPDGQVVDNGQTVTSAVKDLVVAFNENMITDDGTSYNRQHAVDNPANWYLLQDGVVITGAIESIDFGINQSAQMARDTVDENGNQIEQINDGPLAYGTNRWEAVVHLADGFELEDGNYTIVCSNMVQDVARNGLYAQGYAVDGSAEGYGGHDWRCSFTVIPLNEALAFEYSDDFPYQNSYIPVENVHGEEVVGDRSTDPVVIAEASSGLAEQIKATAESTSKAQSALVDSSTTLVEATTARDAKLDAVNDAQTALDAANADVASKQAIADAAAAKAEETGAPEDIAAAEKAASDLAKARKAQTAAERALADAQDEYEDAQSVFEAADEANAKALAADAAAQAVADALDAVEKATSTAERNAAEAAKREAAAAYEIAAQEAKDAAQALVDVMNQQIAEARADYYEARSAYNAAEADVDEAGETLGEAADAAEAALAKFEAAQEKYEKNPTETNRKALEKAEKALNEANAARDAAQTALDAAQAVAAGKLAVLNVEKADLDEAIAAAEAPKAALQSAKDAAEAASSLNTLFTNATDVIALRQVTRDSILNETGDYGPNTAQSVASTSNGDTVIVWVESQTALDGDGKPIPAAADGSYQMTKTVYARTYRALYVVNAEGRREQVIPSEDSESAPIVVYQCTNTYDKDGNLIKGQDPRQASVAISDTGAFAVVWDMATDGVEKNGDRDVYIKKYAFNGGQMMINGNNTTETRVNVETSFDQQYPVVAMDSDGDIVVAWESYNQDGSGWGIYGRRFFTDGFSYGYCNTVQSIQFLDQIYSQGDYIRMTVPALGSKSIKINLTASIKKNVENIKKALIANGLAEEDFAIAQTASDTISIEFKGQYIGQYVDMISVTTSRPTTLHVNVETRQIGLEGAEFAVNETTDNNQRFAAIGMAPDGTFVVSWTSWGQDGDSNVESNIYARRFTSNHLISQTVISDVERVRARTENEFVISNDNIEAHEVAAGEGYESVCRITVGGSTWGENTSDPAESLGSGSLLTSRRHVLTAAHVVCDANGVPIDPTETPIFCTFETAEGNYAIQVEEVTIYPGYTGTFANSIDMAVVTLTTAAPKSLSGYSLYTSTDEIGQIYTRVGYGTYGQADDPDPANRPSGKKHVGQNIYEMTSAEYDQVSVPGYLIYDFDDGTYANDSLGNLYGLRNLGLGDNEVCADHGDSGGPSFINGKIAGVCVFGMVNMAGGYSNPGIIAGDVRVSSYADWITEVVMNSTDHEFLVNTDYSVVTTVDTTDANGNQTDTDTSGTGNTTPTVVYTESDYWMKGNQIWSSVAMDGRGDFVVTWTGYNQDGNGDAQTGGSNNGLGGVFARAFSTDETFGSVLGTNVFRVNDYTDGDQIHSQVAMTQSGDFTIVYESYQDPSNDANSDERDNFGIFARRYTLLREATMVADASSSSSSGTGGSGGSGSAAVGDDDEYVYAPVVAVNGEEFRVSRLGYFAEEYKDLGLEVQDYDQLGGSVAVDANGDMVFTWSDLSNPYSNVESVVCMRAITLQNDSTPPYVTKANAVYDARTGEVDPETGRPVREQAQVSLIGNVYYFESGYGPMELIYGFSEYMFTAQMAADIKNGVFVDEKDYGVDGSSNGTYDYRADANLENRNVKSVIDYNDWTLTRDGKVVTSAYVYDIFYGYNASQYVEEILESRGLPEGTYIYETVPSDYRTNSYELVIVFRQELPDGSYVLTLSDNVADASARNRLDGDYDGESGGSFAVRWVIGNASSDPEELVPSKDTPAFNGAYGGEGEPVVAGNEDGFVIVVEKQLLYEIGASSGNNNNNNNNNAGGTTTTSDDVYGYYETIDIDGVRYRIESDIVMRRFDSTGAPIGSETTVNVHKDGNQIDPDIDMDDDGNFVIGWIGESDDALNGVCARFYPGGQSETKQVQVAGTKGMRCWDVDVAINDESGVVLITWEQGSKNTGTEADEMYGRFYDINGNALSLAFKIVSQSDGKSVQNFDVASMTVDGEIKYVCTWQMYVESTKSFEIFTKVITANKDSKYYYATADTQATRVNETTIHNQYAPQVCTNQDTGEYYIVWVSDQVPGLGGDIYVKRFNVDGDALPFLGTTNESVVNVYTKNVQGRPSVSCNNDGVVFVWESYDAEEYNYNNSTDIKQNLHDYGVSCRVFNSDGMPVYIMGDIVYEVDGIERIREYDYGEVVPLDEGEFMINSTTTGDQFHPSVQIFDWVSSSLSAYKVPKFVVTWAGPNEHAAEEIVDEDGDSSSTGGSGSGSGNQTTATEATSYVGPWSVFYKLISIGGASVTNDPGTSGGSISTLSAGRYAVDPSATNIGGFYRPITTTVELASAQTTTSTSDATIQTLTGTDGDDTVVVTTNASGAIVSVKINGAAVSIAANVSTVYFDGGAGNDAVVYNAGGEDAAYIDANAKKALFVADRAFYALNVESVDANGALSDLTISATNKGDVVSLSPAATSVSGANGFAFTSDFASDVVANGGGRATVVLTGSEGDDAFVATNSEAILVGAGFEFDAKSFAVVRAYTGGGADSATLTDLQTLSANDVAAIGATSKTTIVATGFSSVDAKGLGSSKAVISGTNGDDSFESSAKTTTTTFSTGGVLTTTGFADVAIDGRGGYDAAILTAGPRNNAFEGFADRATLTNGSYNRALTNFANVAVFGSNDDEAQSALIATLHNTARDDAFAAFGDTATMDVDGANLYSVIAADQVNVKRDHNAGETSFDIDEALDFVFSADDWEF